MDLLSVLEHSEPPRSQYFIRLPTPYGKLRVDILSDDPEAAMSQGLVGEDAERANAMVNEAVRRAQRSEFVSAEELLLETVRHYPYCYDAFGVLCDVSLSLGRTGDAVYFGRQVVALVPSYHNLTRLGRALGQDGKLHEAATVQYHLWQVRQETDRDEALEAIHGYLVTLAKLDDPGPMTDVCAQALREYPGDPTLLYQLAYAFLLQGRLAEAHAVAERALATLPLSEQLVPRFVQIRDSVAAHLSEVARAARPALPAGTSSGASSSSFGTEQYARDPSAVSGAYPYPGDPTPGNPYAGNSLGSPGTSPGNPYAGNSPGNPAPGNPYAANADAHAASQGGGLNGAATGAYAAAGFAAGAPPAGLSPSTTLPPGVIPPAPPPPGQVPDRIAPRGAHAAHTMPPGTIPPVGGNLPHTMPPGMIAPVNGSAVPHAPAGNPLGAPAAPPRSRHGAPEPEFGLADIIAAVEGGNLPPADGGLTVVPGEGECAVLAFTAHAVVAADVDPDWIRDQLPPDDLGAPLNPPFLTALAQRTGRVVNNIDMIMLAPRLVGRLPIPLSEMSGRRHPRVRRALRYRDEVHAWATEGGVLVLGRGVGGRWELAIEVDPEYRGEGLGRTLAAAGRHLVPGDMLWAQVAPGNAASVRAFLAAGFIPVGSEALLVD